MRFHQSVMMAFVLSLIMLLCCVEHEELEIAEQSNAQLSGTELWVPRYREIQIGMNKAQVEDILGQSEDIEPDGSSWYGDCPAISTTESPYTGHCIQIGFSEAGRVCRKEFYPDGQIYSKEHYDEYVFPEPINGDLHELWSRSLLDVVRMKDADLVDTDPHVSITFRNQRNECVPKIKITTDSCSREATYLEPEHSITITMPIGPNDLRTSTDTDTQHFVIHCVRSDERYHSAQTRSYWIPCPAKVVRIDTYFEINLFGISPAKCVVEHK